MIISKLKEAGVDLHFAREHALLANPRNRSISHVLQEVVALFRCPGWTDDFGALVNGRIPLVGLTRYKTVEVFKPRASRPTIKRPNRTRFPHRDLMTLAELRGRVAIQP